MNVVDRAALVRKIPERYAASSRNWSRTWVFPNGKTGGEIAAELLALEAEQRTPERIDAIIGTPDWGMPGCDGGCGVGCASPLVEVCEEVFLCATCLTTASGLLDAKLAASSSE